jgi:hypothetical protein
MCLCFTLKVTYPSREGTKVTAKKDTITMLHGAGGTVMHDLVKNYVVKYFGGVGNA